VTEIVIAPRLGDGSATTRVHHVLGGAGSYSCPQYDLVPKLVDLVRQAAVIVVAGYDAAAAPKVTTTIGVVAL
jgi:hypothetical protein